MEAALAAHAGYVVSGDAALLNLKHHRGIEIVRPARFLKVIASTG
jgi:predicted nucleic acid-binding protein